MSRAFPFIGALLLGAALNTSGCARFERADLVLTGGRIFTADPSRPWAEALAVRGERIAAVGSTAEIERLAGSKTRRVSLAGRLVIPGLNDAHVHLGPQLSGARLKLSGGMDPGFDEMIAAIETAHRKESAGLRLFATIGASVLDDPRAARATLDRAAPGRFVLLSSWAGHTSIASTAALRALGISEEEPDPAGGWYERQPGSRRVSGVIQEYAEYSLSRRLAEAEGEAATVRALREVAGQAVRFGITTLQDMSTALPVEKAAAALRTADVPIRVRLIRFPIPGPGGGATRHGEGPDADLAPRVTVSGVKWILDGTPIERNAAIREAYADRPGWLGRMNFPDAEVVRMLTEARGSGEQLMLHSVGDRCVERTLVRMEELGGEGIWTRRRVRIEHGDGLMEDLFVRAKKLGVVVVQNPIHFTFPELLVRRFGTARAKKYQPLRSLLSAGISLAIGSDGPLNPFLQIACAVSHPNNPAEAITVEQALRAYTRGSAFAEFTEKQKGTLAPGYLADFAVLSQDIFAAPPAMLPETESVLTVVGGRVVYEAPAPPR